MSLSKQAQVLMIQNIMRDFFANNTTRGDIEDEKWFEKISKVEDGLWDVVINVPGHGLSDFIVKIDDVSNTVYEAKSENELTRRECSICTDSVRHFDLEELMIDGWYPEPWIDEDTSLEPCCPQCYNKYLTEDVDGDLMIDRVLLTTEMSTILVDGGVATLKGEFRRSIIKAMLPGLIQDHTQVFTLSQLYDQLIDYAATVFTSQDKVTGYDIKEWVDATRENFPKDEWPPVDLDDVHRCASSLADFHNAQVKPSDLTKCNICGVESDKPLGWANIYCNRSELPGLTCKDCQASLCWDSDEYPGDLEVRPQKVLQHMLDFGTFDIEYEDDGDSHHLFNVGNCRFSSDFINNYMSKLRWKPSQS